MAACGSDKPAETPNTEAPAETPAETQAETTASNTEAPADFDYGSGEIKIWVDGVEKTVKLNPKAVDSFEFNYEREVNNRKWYDGRCFVKTPKHNDSFVFSCKFNSESDDTMWVE